MRANLLSIALGLVAFSGTVAASDYTVAGTSYSNAATLSSTALWDDYELVAASGKSISYKVAATSAGGCVQLFFAKGHNVTIFSKYLVTYSQKDCVASYSDAFPVGSSDGTEFSILVASNANSDVAYTLDITITDALPSWVVGLVILVVIGALAGGVGAIVRRGRRRKAFAPPLIATYGANPPPPPPGAPLAPRMEPEGPPQKPPP